MSNTSTDEKPADKPQAAPPRNPWLLRGVAIVALLLVGAQVVFHVTVETTSLYLLIIACVALAFPEVEKFSFSKDGISLEKRFERLDERMDQVQAGNAELSTAMTTGVGGKAAPAAKAALSHPETPAAALAPVHEEAPQDPDDPQAGRWGGSAEVGGRRVCATVVPSSLRSDWFKVEVVVESTSPNKPLSGTATFHLHPTFQENPAVRPVVGGVAKLELLAWGAFTVGVEADGGATRLEINLAGVKGAPAAFTSR